ncbi:MAG: hypothetical protein HYX73_03960 [Acidobacteria bacterium]|nr:hypothetical protein [Acidobacteriota bacterium]
MNKIVFDPRTDGLEQVRQVIFRRLREDSGWEAFDYNGQGYEKYIEIKDRDKREAFILLAMEVCWELIFQGVLTPGLNSMNPNLPWFRRTAYGKKVIAEQKFIPHDPTEYLKSFSEMNPNPDPTTLAYLTESLECFRLGAMVASNLLLGVAAERVFLRVCTSLEPALSDPKELQQFQKLLAGIGMKAKLDWVRQKIENIQKQKPRPLPEDVDVALNGVYTFIRAQRNDLGHPKDDPPNVSREQVFMNLRLFPTYYSTAEAVRTFLASNQV